MSIYNSLITTMEVSYLKDDVVNIMSFIRKLGIDSEVSLIHEEFKEAMETLKKETNIESVSSMTPDEKRKLTFDMCISVAKLNLKALMDIYPLIDYVLKNNKVEEYVNQKSTENYSE